MNAARVHLARNAWGRIAIAGLLIAELSAVPAVVPSLLTAAAAPASAAPTLSVTPAGITAGDSYTVSGAHFDPGQKVVVNALPACSNLPAGNPTKPGNQDPTCDTDGGHPETFGSVIAITPAADGSFAQSFFSSPLLSDATYNILATSQRVAGDKDDRTGRAVATVNVHAANPAVSLSSNIVSNFSFISATMTGYAPGETVCVADFTTFGNCAVANASGTASIPLPPDCIVPAPGGPPTIICLHPIAEQKRQGLLPMTTTVLAIGATSLRTSTTALTIVPHHAAVSAAIDTQAQTLTLTATGMLSNEGSKFRGQGILFPRGVAEDAIADPIVPGTAPTGHASHTYSLACPNPAFPAGTFSLGVFGFASNLTPQTVPDVTIPDSGCPTTGQTLTASNTNLIEGDTTTLTASGFVFGDQVTFTVEAPAPLTGGRLKVGPIAVDAAGTASASVKVDCCEELHSSLLTFVQNADGSRSAFGSSPLHVLRPVPIVSPDSNFIQAGQPLTLSGSGYRANQAIQLFLGDLVPCKTNDPTLNNPDPSPKCGPIASPGLPFRGVTNLGAPSVTTATTDASGNFNITVPTSYLTSVDGLSMAALPFDRAHPGPRDPGISIQHANGFVAIERFHPQITMRLLSDRTIAFEGSGFAPREHVQITDGGVARNGSFTTTADANGTFRGRFAIQSNAPTGTYALTATGQTSGLFDTTSFSAELETAFFQVTTTADAPQMGAPNAACASTLPGNPCTLRAAVQAANFLGGGPHTISLPTAGTYALTTQAGGGEETSAAGDLDIIGTNVIVANTSDGAVKIDGNQADRVFDIGPAANPADPASPPRPAQVSISGVTIQNGAVPSVGGGIKVNGGSSLELTNVTVSGNRANANGGGIFNVGTLTLNNVTISGNGAGVLGGGLFTANLATLNNSVVRTNTVSGGLQQGALGGGIFNSKTLTLNGVTVQDNQILSGTAGGIANAPTGTMNLTNVTLSGNQAAIGGGSLTAGTSLVDGLTVSGNHSSMAEAGFANGGAASLSNILVQGNSSDDINGGLGNGAFMTITTALIRDNKAVNINGGFANIGVARLENVTISGNSASSVAGLGNLSSLQMTNSTISGNQALGGGLLKPEHQGLGGGLANGALAKVTNSTIANNSASGSGGGFASDPSVVATEQDRAATIELVLGCPGPNCRPFVFPSSPPTALLQNSLVANSPHGGDCFGFITSLGFNLSSDSTCKFTNHGDLNGTNPRLGRLQNNGGPALGDARDRNTPYRGAVPGDDNLANDDHGFGPGRGSPTLTQALQHGSPAIDAIPVANCSAPDTDQRGIERPQGPGCDIGAYEAK